MPNATWLADVLRAAGLKVEEVPGWQNRGRAEMGAIAGVICHHTGTGGVQNAPTLNLVIKGREDLPGPLSQMLLARDGTFYVIAAGRCNHAGRGTWQGIGDGNNRMLGIEAENAGNGKDPWPADQMRAYAVGVAAILKHIGADDVMVCGHKEYATPRGRKIDPSFDMVEFRADVEAVMAGTPAAPTRPAGTDPRRSMLRKGDQGEDVKLLQRALMTKFVPGMKIITDDGAFGPATEAAVKIFQKAKGLVDDGLVGPATWKALGFA